MRKRGFDKLSNVFTLHSRYLLVGLGDRDAESRDNGKRFIVRAEEKLTAFLELEFATRRCMS
jgi:hypothetical protein